MLDIAWKNLDSQRNRFKDIDTKAIGIITISGILMTFITKSLNCEYAPMIFFILTSLAFLVTIILSVRVIRLRETDMISTNNLITQLREEDKERQIRGIIGTIAKVEKSLQTACDTKSNELQYSVYSLGCSVLFLTLYSLSTASPTISKYAVEIYKTCF